MPRQPMFEPLVFIRGQALALGAMEMGDQYGGILEFAQRFLDRPQAPYEMMQFRASALPGQFRGVAEFLDADSIDVPVMPRSRAPRPFELHRLGENAQSLLKKAAQLLSFRRPQFPVARALRQGRLHLIRQGRYPGGDRAGLGFESQINLALCMIERLIYRASEDGILHPGPGGFKEIPRGLPVTQGPQ